MDAFDFIVIGAGSAGCVVASRLSEDAGATVLLLEAGTAQVPPGIDDPLNFASFFGSAVDWDYETERQPGLVGRTTRQPRGRLLGGTGNLYGMMHQRCPAADYDGWARAGAPGWAWTDVAPWFRRIEDSDDPAREHLGRGGPIPLVNARSRPHSPLSDGFLAACGERAHPTGIDLNGTEVRGAGWIDFNIKDGRRFGSRTAYLEPALRTRSNLTLAADAVATRLLFSSGDGDRRCLGVEYVQAGQTIRAEAAGEVILCAGPIETPKLLLLSGIGAPDELRLHGIGPLVPLPGVGSDLHDHVMVWARAPLARSPGASRFANFETALFFPSEDARTVSNLEIICMTGGFEDFATGRAPTALDLVAGLAQPAARGWVKLASGDWRTPPRIHPNYLGEADDAIRLVRALEEARALLATRAMADWVGAERLPGPAIQGRADLLAFVHGHALSQWHLAGSCRMGSDAGAVVDPALRVRGTPNLRIADSSVMPTITSGHCHAAVLMIAERAADLIRRDHGFTTGSCRHDASGAAIA